MFPRFPLTYTLSISQNALETYGHVNNAIYVQWIQDACTRSPSHLNGHFQPQNTGWIAHRHRIEYLDAACVGTDFEVRTWLVEVRLTRVLRKYEITRAVDGQLVAIGQSEWIFVNLTTGQPVPIPAEVRETLPG